MPRKPVHSTSMRWCGPILNRGALVAFLLGAAGCGPGLAPSATVTTTMQGWEHYFRLEYAPRPTANGTLIDGYVHNTYGSPMGSVRLLGQAFDAQNNVIAQRIEW